MKAAPVRQRGVALLIALLVVALASVLVAGLLDRGELTLARTRNALRAEQAAAYGEGLEAYAAQVLMRDLADDPIDTRTDAWALPLPPQTVPGGTITAQLRDLNGCFNLNNLVAPSRTEAAVWRRRYARLLAALGLDPALVGATVDWLDADASPEAEGGAEDSAYLALPVPYRAANRVFAHVSELRLVRGVDGAAYARLLPEVCALPPGNALNLNTANPPVLMSLAPGMTQALAERIALDGRARWTSVEDALAEAQRQGVVLAPAERVGLGVSSHYFLAHGEIELDGLPIVFDSLLERRIGADGGVRVLARSRGGDVLAPTAPPLP